MKNQIIAMIVLLFALHAQAQMEIPDLSGVKVQLSSDTISTTESTTKNQTDIFIHGQDSIFLGLNCSSEDNVFTSSNRNARPAEVKVVDAMDINDDGTNELILFREWSCSTPPKHFNEFGVGTSSETNGQYEVWDVKNKHKLLEFKSTYWYQYIVSTNVVRGSSYNYDVTFDSNGNLHYDQVDGLQEGEENSGTYKFDRKSGAYILK